MSGGLLLGQAEEFGAVDNEEHRPQVPLEPLPVGGCQRGEDACFFGTLLVAGGTPDPPPLGCELHDHLAPVVGGRQPVDEAAAL